MVSDFYDRFLAHLDAGDKRACVELALSELSSGGTDVVTLYEKVLGPALNSFECHNDEKKLCIWKEHIRSAIIRTIMECCYPHVLREKDERYGSRDAGRAAVLCPDGEYHELGARMASDFYTLCGYDVSFIGSSTPREDFPNLIESIRPKLVALSVTNRYNLVAAKKTIEVIRSKIASPVIIVAGGRVFRESGEACRNIGADTVADSFEDIRNLTREKEVEA